MMPSTHFANLLWRPTRHNHGLVEMDLIEEESTYETMDMAGRTGRSVSRHIVPQFE